MTWPHVREAVVSLLTATDGLTYREICDSFHDIGAPFGVVEIREAISGLAFAGTVHLCGQVWLQKRDRAASELCNGVPLGTITPGAGHIEAPV